MEMSEGTKGMKWADSQGLWTNVCKPTAGGFEANFANAKLAQDRTAFWIHRGPHAHAQNLCHTFGPKDTERRTQTTQTRRKTLT